MKKLLIKVGSFSAPLLFLLGLIFFTPVEKEMMYDYASGSCYGRPGLIGQRIHRDDRAIDIAIIGSSRSFNSLDDKRLTQELGVQVANLACCGTNRNQGYVIVKDLLKVRDPKIVVLEINEHENRFTHELFPYLADAEDVLFAPLWYNPDYFKDLNKAFMARLDLLREIKMDSYELRGSADLPAYGYDPSPDTADVSILESGDTKRSAKLYSSGFQESFNYNYGRGYVKRIARLCKNNNAELMFVYIPRYGKTDPPARYLDFYGDFGPVLKADFLYNSELWRDAGHMNLAGGQLLTGLLSTELEAVLQQKVQD